MRKIKRQWMLLAVAVLAAGTMMTVNAFVALSTTTTLTVKEPLTIQTATGSFGTSSLACSVDSSGTVATCTGSAFAGESGGINLQIGNFASVGIAVTIAATSSSGDATLNPPSQTGTVPAATNPGGIGFLPGILRAPVAVTVSPSAAPGPVTITITVSR
jgi:hypothetical protein